MVGRHLVCVRLINAKLLPRFPERVQIRGATRLIPELGALTSVRDASRLPPGGRTGRSSTADPLLWPRQDLDSHRRVTARGPASSGEGLWARSGLIQPPCTSGRNVDQREAKAHDIPAFGAGSIGDASARHVLAQRPLNVSGPIAHRLNHSHPVILALGGILCLMYCVVIFQKRRLASVVPAFEGMRGESAHEHFALEQFRHQGFIGRDC